jgi:DNA-binding XRE family transcriptional regulator
LGGRGRQISEFEANQVCRVPGQPGLHRETLSHNNKTKQNENNNKTKQNENNNKKKPKPNIKVALTVACNFNNPFFKDLFIYYM